MSVGFGARLTWSTLEAACAAMLRANFDKIIAVLIIVPLKISIFLSTKPSRKVKMQCKR
jgi:hypothetical protein